MRAILFCNLPYAFSILQPLQEELKKREIKYVWYIPKELINLFSHKDEPITSDIKSLKDYNADMIFVPGNDIPHFLRGVKVQIFHGLAGEKKGHFRIREYFDLYLTQGPYFTKRFKKLQEKHKNFEVIETGWCKLDNLFKDDSSIKLRKEKLLKESKASKIILYAPTFSPSLTSATQLKDKIKSLSQDPKYLLLIKFHDKMDKKIKDDYKKLEDDKLQIIEDDDITNLLKLSDLMISDTSSVVYEFLLLDKPVITLNSHSENINWLDLKDPSSIINDVEMTLYKNDDFKDKRDKIISNYHPYSDAKSASRMIDATLEYIKRYGVPQKRKISLLRKYKMIKKYGFTR
jgi:CDP-glycerol glycerophosphotransferase (TagB/SpsB family)